MPVPVGKGAPDEVLSAPFSWDLMELCLTQVLRALLLKVCGEEP